MTEFIHTSGYSAEYPVEYKSRSDAHEGRILQIAARGMNVNVGAEEVEYWRVASQTAAALDTLVDEKGWRDISPIFDAVISDDPQGVEGVITDEEAKELARFYNNLSSQRQDAWYQAANSLPRYADSKAGASNIGELVAVTLGEAEDVFTPAFQLDTQGKPDENQTKTREKNLTGG